MEKLELKCTLYSNIPPQLPLCPLRYTIGPHLERCLRAIVPLLKRRTKNEPRLAVPSCHGDDTAKPN